MEAASGRVVNNVESGRLNEAYDEARELLKRRPDSGIAHFTMSYVFTYGGLLDDAARECDAALAIDPSNYGFRACSLNFFELGKYDRALDFALLDAGSDWSTRNEAGILVREGKLDEALKLLESRQTAVGHRGGNVVEAFLEHHSASEIAALAKQSEADLMADRDPENKYLVAAYDAFAGQGQIALRLLRRAVEHNYCGYPAMDNDPLFASIRNTPEFASIRAEGVACQNKFKEHIAGQDSK